jgi:hypothetical protein
MIGRIAHRKYKKIYPTTNDETSNLAEGMISYDVVIQGEPLK